MDRLSIFLSFAIVCLALSYVLFTGQEYFSVVSMIIIFIIVISAFLIFLLSYIYSSLGSLVLNHKADRRIILCFAIVIALIIFEAYFDSGSSSIGQIPVVIILVSTGVGISIAGVYLLGKFTRKLKSYSLYAVIIIGIIITSALSYGVMYGLRGVNWNGIDELGFNYYAAYLFVHGTNPYTASMAPILQQRSIFPTVQLNGTYEFAYDYPALSFLPYSFMPLLGISSFFVFIVIATFLSVMATYIVYRKSGYNNLILIPLAVWLFITFTLVGTSNQYLAVSVLFLIAYLERKRPLLSGALLGVAASIIQLVWFAIPFFFILVLREYGNRHLGKCVAAAIAAFLIVNSYFIIISPVIFLKSIFYVFGLSKLVFYGPNIMQFFVSHYYVASWYPLIVSVTTLIASLFLYYFYTRTLKPLIVLIPMTIFFLTWRNISIYGLPFVPVILAIFYVNDKDSNSRLHDIIKSKLPLIYSIAVLAVIFVAAAVYSHAEYVRTDAIKINSILPILYGQPNFTGPFSLGGIRINVANNGSKAEPISFFIVSRYPDGQQYILSSQLNGTSTGLQVLAPYSSSNYTLPYQLQLVNNNTKVYIFAFSPDYITSKEIQINLAH